MTGFSLNTAQDIRHGDGDVNYVYLGNDLIWSRQVCDYNIYNHIYLPQFFTEDLGGLGARGPYTVDTNDNITATYGPMINVIDLDLCGAAVGNTNMTRMSELLAYLKNMEQRIAALEN